MDRVKVDLYSLILMSRYDPNPTHNIRAYDFLYD
jgi:hypothetical protein